MICLLDVVGHAFERGRRMVELARDFNAEIRMTPHRVIVDGDAAISGNHASIRKNHQWIHLDAAGIARFRESEDRADRCRHRRALRC